MNNLSFPYQRILILGSPGSGKSTLARKLSERLAITVHHLDRMWWKPHWKHVTRWTFQRRINTVLKQPSWIIDGHYSRTLPIRLKFADAVIYLDFNVETCLNGITSRRISAGTRPDMTSDCVEHDDPDFVEYVRRFPETKGQETKRLLVDFKGHIVFLHTHEEVEAFLSTLQSDLPL